MPFGGYSPIITMFKNENSFEEWKPAMASIFVLSVSSLKMRIPLRSGNLMPFGGYSPIITMFKNENSFEEWKPAMASIFVLSVSSLKMRIPLRSGNN